MDVLKEWMDVTRDRLASAGFTVTRDINCDGRIFRIVAQRTRLEITKCGFAEYFWMIGELDRPDAHEIRRFSADAFRFAKSRKAVPLPCGLFEGVLCFAVAIVNSVDHQTIAEIRTVEPPTHWAAIEMPVIVESTSLKLHYFEKMPIWGYVYYPRLRREIRQLLENR